MATLQYQHWGLTGDSRLVLEGKSIGNGQTIEFADTLDIVSFSGDTLTLGKGDMYRIQYVRRQDDKGLIGGSDAAMGYTWSEMLQKKIRVFEEGSRVHSVVNPQSSSAGIWCLMLILPNWSFSIRKRMSYLTAECVRMVRRYGM